GPLGNTCHQIVMGNGRVESCFAHDSLSVVVGMPGLLRAQGGVCSEMPRGRLSIHTAGQPWGGRSIEQVCSACQSSLAPVSRASCGITLRRSSPLYGPQEHHLTTWVCIGIPPRRGSDVY